MVGQLLIRQFALVVIVVMVVVVVMSVNTVVDDLDERFFESFEPPRTSHG